MVDKFAVIGNPIAHSLSPLIHQHFATQTRKSISYEKVETDLDQFESTVLNFFGNGGKGLNITSPFKELAFSLAEIKHADCTPGNAVNTLWLENGKIHADNTDGKGLIVDLSKFFSLVGKRVLIIGAGGATRSIISSLLQAKIKGLTVANRTYKKIEELERIFPEIYGCDLASIQGDFDLIINSTSLHLNERLAQGEGFEHLLSESILKPITYCYDLGYMSQEKLTPFIQWARAKNCLAQDGLGMLIQQAAESFYRWYGVRPLTEKLFEFLKNKI